MHGRFLVDVVSLQSMTQEAPLSDAATHVAAKRRNEKDVVQEVPLSSGIAAERHVPWVGVDAILRSAFGHSARFAGGGVSGGMEGSRRTGRRLCAVLNVAASRVA